MAGTEVGVRDGVEERATAGEVAGAWDEARAEPQDEARIDVAVEPASALAEVVEVAEVAELGEELAELAEPRDEARAGEPAEWAGEQA